MNWNITFFHKAFFKKEMQMYQVQIFFAELLLWVSVIFPFDPSPSYVIYICTTARRITTWRFREF